MRFSVKAIRVNVGISQREAAKHLGISLTAYVRKENGRSQFWAHEIQKLSILFGVDIDVFFEPLCPITTQRAAGGGDAQ